MKTELTHKQKRYLRTLSHNCKPLVIIGGNGLTDNVVTEIESTIAHHELIKIRINAEDKTSRDEMIKNICDKVGCQLVFSIGHVATFYKPTAKANKTSSKNVKQRISLPRD